MIRFLHWILSIMPAEDVVLTECRGNVGRLAKRLANELEEALSFADNAENPNSAKPCVALRNCSEITCEDCAGFFFLAIKEKS